MGTTRSLAVAQNKATEAVRNIAAKAARQMFEKKKKVQDKKSESQKAKCSYPNKSEKAIVASTNRDGNLNEWDPENMKNACEQYDTQKLPPWPANKPKLSLRFSLNLKFNLNLKQMSQKCKPNHHTYLLLPFRALARKYDLRYSTF